MRDPMGWVLTAILIACGIGLLASLVINERTRKATSIATGLIGLATVLVAICIGSFAITRWVMGS